MKESEFGVLGVCVNLLSHASPLRINSCGVLLDHCVQLTGWGEENNIPYWNIRNSWGESWGENGYIRVERNKSERMEVVANGFHSHILFASLFKRTRSLRRCQGGHLHLYLGASKHGAVFT